ADDQSKATGLAQAGRQLAEARSAAGLSQEQLASQMHMGVEQLAALEGGDQNELPEPVFIKAMVRRVASKLGIDPEPLVQGLSSSPRLKTSTASRWDTQETQDAKARPNLLLPLSGLAALAACLLAAFHLDQLGPIARKFAAMPSAPEPKAQPQTVSGTEEVSAEPSPPTSTASQSIVVRSQEPSWVVIRDGEGGVLFEGTLNTSKTFNGERGLEIYAGRPDLVSTSQEGVSQAGTPLGTIDQVRWYRVTAAPSRSKQDL
ncbi:MAG: helix-turn-helix domain-containing protein, partial [Synechococcaceae bacterium WB9_4xC_028]|nr:helix-turn-helix domain-containing protein [Synechococcaceae bacterium WB9_4xC_028]